MNCTFLSVDLPSRSVAAYLAHSITLQGIISVSSDPIAHRSTTPAGHAFGQGFPTVLGIILTVLGIMGGDHGGTKG